MFMDKAIKLNVDLKSFEYFLKYNREINFMVDESKDREFIALITSGKFIEEYE